MTIEEAKQTMYALACTHYGKEFYEKENEAIKIACKSLEAWEKVKKEIKQIRIHCGYLDVQGVTIIEVLEIIDKHLREVDG